MPIPSLIFILLFLPFCVLLYHSFFFSRTAQNIILLTASLMFYTAGQTVYILVLLFSIAWNYAMGLAVGRCRKNGHGGKLAAGIAVAVNVLIPVMFLAVNQAPAILRPIFQIPSGYYKVLMPLGLAYYTLQAVGYCLDVYRGEASAEKNPLALALYLSFFPKITMGPLIDYSEMSRQITDRRHTVAGVSRGLCRFVTGLSKKLLIADQLDYPVNYIFTQSTMDNAVVQLPVSLAWFGALAFALQLYFELSAMADMAVGLGGMFGFDLPENFRYPLAAVSITDFWRRWNITFLAWFRKYVFGSLPKKENHDHLIRDLLITWILFGLWVGGLKWTALFWGVLNFLLLLAEHFFGYSDRIPGRFLKHSYSVLAVITGFVLLRSPTLYNAGQYFSSMLWLNNNGFGSDLVPVFLREYWAPLGLGALLSIPLPLSLPLRLPLVPALNVPAQRLCRSKPLIRAAKILYPICIIGLLALCMVLILQNMTVTAPLIGQWQ